MIALLQRVRSASVVVNQQTIASIDQGLLVLLGVQPEDNESIAEKLINKVIRYRVFSDVEGKMNLALRDTAGGLLLVPQFTLAADTTRGNRASFTSAAPPALGNKLFDYCKSYLATQYPSAEFGQFGADMQVNLTNDGPVTFWLEAN